MVRQRRRNASLAVCGLVLLGALGCQSESNQVERDREAAAQRLRRAPLTGDSLRVALITNRA